jgi:L-ascorbate metabolism protein UlaG (beta-lactamase superfamily)
MKILLFTFLSYFLGIIGCREKPKDNAEAVNSFTASNSYEKKDVPLITPIEHASAVISWGETIIYVDPVGGVAAFGDQPAPDLILITDIHGDHLNVETLKGLNTSAAVIIAPEAVAGELPEDLKARTQILNNGQTLEEYSIKVEAIPMYNLREEAKDFHVKGRGNGYVLEKDGMRIYFSGDTEDIPEMRALKDIDKAFICMNMPYTMTVESAADAVLEFAPGQVYPYHFRGRPEVSDVAEFKRLVNQGDPAIEVVQLDWYPKEPY